jgi:hypothetical protein
LRCKLTLLLFVIVESEKIAVLKIIRILIDLHDHVFDGLVSLPHVPVKVGDGGADISVVLIDFKAHLVKH